MENGLEKKTFPEYDIQLGYSNFAKTVPFSSILYPILSKDTGVKHATNIFG